MVARLKNEPALILGLVQAALALAVSFGLNLSPGQMGTIVAFSAAAFAVIVRQNVSPTGNASGTMVATTTLPPAQGLVATG